MIDMLAIYSEIRRSIKQRYALFLIDKRVFLLTVSTASSNQQSFYCTDDLGYPLLTV